MDGEVKEKRKAAWDCGSSEILVCAKVNEEAGAVLDSGLPHQEW